jgi:hypothetical protein
MTTTTATTITTITEVTSSRRAIVDPPRQPKKIARA